MRTTTMREPLEAYVRAVLKAELKAMDKPTAEAVHLMVTEWNIAHAQLRAALPDLEASDLTALAVTTIGRAIAAMLDSETDQTH